MAFSDKIDFYRKYYYIHHFLDEGTMEPNYSFRGLEDKEIYFRFVLGYADIENYNRGYRVEKIENMFSQLNIVVRDKKLEEILKDDKF